jgi:hypothetical protein
VSLQLTPARWWTLIRVREAWLRHVNGLTRRGCLPWLFVFAILLTLCLIQVGPVRHVKEAAFRDTTLNTTNVNILRIVGFLRSDLTVWDWTLLCIAAFLLFAMIGAEIRQHAIRKFISNTFKSDQACLFFLLLCLIGATRYYLSPGWPVTWDGQNHLGHTEQVALNLRRGSLPYWSNYWYAGFPLLQFSGPLYYIVTAVLSLGVGLAAAMKGIGWGAHLLSCFAVYAYLRSVSVRREAAFLGALAYGLCFLHAYTVIWAGKMPECLIFLFFPMAFWTIERSLRDGQIRINALLLGATFALLILTHPASGTSAIVFVLTYAVIRAVAERRVAKSALVLAASGVVAFVLTACVTLPGIAERHLVHLGTSRSLPVISWHYAIPPTERLRWLLAWGNQWTSDKLAYIGISLLLLSAVTTALALWRKQRASVAGALAVGVVLACATFGGDDLEIRNAYFLPFYVSALTGLFFAFDSEILGRWRGWHTAAVCLILLDLGPTTFQAPFRPDLDWQAEGKVRQARAAESHRVLALFRLEGQRLSSFEWDNGWGSDMGVPLGSFTEAATTVLEPTRAVIASVAEDFNRGYVSESTVQLLSLWDIRYIVTSDRRHYYLPKLAGNPRIEVNELLPAYVIKDATPVLFSRNVLPWTNGTAVEPSQLTASMGIDLDNRCAQNFYAVLASKPEAKSVPAVQTDRLKVLSYVVEPQQVRATVECPADGYLHLAAAWYPFQRVSVDGRTVPRWQSPCNFTVFPIGSGRHTVVLVPLLSPLRKCTLLLSGVSWAVLLIFACGCFIRRHQLRRPAG